MLAKEEVNRALGVVLDNKGVIEGGTTLIYPELDCGVVSDIEWGCVPSELRPPLKRIDARRPLEA
jgi:hypothetical protein